MIDIPESHALLLLQGGATLQFAGVPLNLCGGEKKGNDYVVYGSWSNAAFDEASKYSSKTTNIINSKIINSSFSTISNLKRIPVLDEWNLSDPKLTKYVYYTSNESKDGVEFRSTPVLSHQLYYQRYNVEITKSMSTSPSSRSTIGGDNLSTDSNTSDKMNVNNFSIFSPESDSVYSKNPSMSSNLPVLVADMTSNLLSRPVDVHNHGVIIAGHSKNILPAGLTSVIVQKDVIATHNLCPSYCSYRGWLDTGDSHLNTPPVFNVYVLGCYLDWIKSQGSLSWFDEQGKKKAALIYDIIDNSDGFYYSQVDPISRSRMSIPFRIMINDQEDTTKWEPSTEMEEKFFSEAESRHGLVYLAGMKKSGDSPRIALYNSLPIETVQLLADFMIDFKIENNHC